MAIDPRERSQLGKFVRSALRGASETLWEEVIREVRNDERNRLMAEVVEKVNRGEVVQGLRRVVKVDDPERLLPPEIVEFYGRLVDRALVGPAGVFVGDPIEKAKGRAVTRVSSGQVETRGGAKGSRKSGGSKDFIRDEKAFFLKSRIDRKLRKLAREIKVWLKDSDELRQDVRRCSACRKFGEPEWLHCPRCGKPMESV